jgi:hypothetical protein
MIIGRSLAAAMAGALPVPVVEEWLSATIRRGTIRRLSRVRSVDITDDAIHVIADGAEAPPTWPEILGGRVLFRILSRSWRRVLVAALAARRMRAAQDHYLVGTLFDHYCARLHIGLGLDEATARGLRVLMDKSIAETEGGLSRRMFRDALLATARTSIRLPFELLNWASGGAVRKLLKRRAEFEAASEVNEALEKQLNSKRSFLARSAAAVEIKLAAESNPYLSRLLDNFEKAWRDSQATTG